MDRIGRDAEALGQRTERVAGQRRQQDRGQLPCVEARVLEQQTLLAHESEVEGDVVSDDREATGEPHHRPGDLLEARLVKYIPVADAGKHGDFEGDRAARVDQRSILLDNLSIGELDSADLDDGVSLRVDTGRFQVQRDECSRHGASLPGASRRSRQSITPMKHLV